MEVLDVPLLATTRNKVALLSAVEEFTEEPESGDRRTKCNPVLGVAMEFPPLMLEGPGVPDVAGRAVAGADMT
jgi:hypothetical protein